MGDILFLAHRVPFPPDRGDKIRSFNILRHLAEHRRVHLVAFADQPEDMDRGDWMVGDLGERVVIRRTKSQGLAAVQALASRRPVSLAAFDSGALRDAVDSILHRHPIESIYVFSSQMAQYLPPRPRQRVVMDFVDMDSAKFAAYAEQSRGPRRAMFAREARSLAAWEKSVAERADANLLVSEAEAALFRRETGAPNVHVVENGIDTTLFDPAARFSRVEEAGPLIVFTGQMDYRPNIAAVSWFAEEILPGIRARHADARFAIVGRNPSDAVRALAGRPGVIVTGEVADVRGWLAAAAVVTAPLRLARGIQNKVLEAMAMARPVVASTAAAEGIDHDGTIRTGDSAEAIGEAVSALLASPAQARELGARARAQVQRRYSWAARLAPLDAIMGFDRPARRVRPAA